MTRKSDSTMEKINELYKTRAFLKTKYELQMETVNRTRLEKHRSAAYRTFKELEDNQREIDKLLDADL